jgi:hypothetical protein
MLLRLVGVCLLWLWAALSLAQTGPQAVLSWLPNDEPDVAGYRIYQTFTAGSYVMVGPTYATFPGQTTVTVYLPQAQCSVQYFWVVTAIDFAGHESPRSIEVSKTIVGSHYTVKACDIQ